MAILSRPGLRTWLTLAFVGVAVLAVVTATALDDRGVSPSVSTAARARLRSSAARLAVVAADLHKEHGAWGTEARATLLRLATLEDLHVRISDAYGRRLFGQQLTGPTSPLEPIRDGGRSIALLQVSPARGMLLSPAEAHLERALDTGHVMAGLIAVVAALGVAALLAEAISRPLRRIGQTAERISQGDLTARIRPSGTRELRAVSKALNGLAETLDHEEEVRRQSVADLAHELRTPVHGLLSRVEGAQDSVFGDRRANLAAMHAETLRLGRLLDDLSRLAEAERPGLLLDKEILDLAGVAMSRTEPFEQRFAEAGIELRLELEHVRVAADPDRLGQIVDNLLENALRYTESGFVSVAVRREKALAVLEVADSGIGIDASDLRHIFTRFWRGEKSRSRATGGTGVGLTIVEQLVRAHDGEIDVDSSVGRGSRFRVFLEHAESATVEQERSAS